MVVPSNNRQWSSALKIEPLKQSINDLLMNGEGEVSLVYHSDEGVLGIAPDRVVRAASVVKLFILVEAYRRIERGELNRDSLIEIEDRFCVGGAGVLSSLSPRTCLTLHDLLTLMIVISDNTASNIVLDKLGFQGVAGTVAALGASNTRIERLFCDQGAVLEGRDNFTTASDAVKVLRCLAEPNDLVGEDSRRDMWEILSRQQLRLKLPAYFPEDGTVGVLNKTGELPGVEHDIAIIVAKGRLDYLAVLTCNWQENANGQRRVADIGRLVYRHIIGYPESID